MPSIKEEGARVLLQDELTRFKRLQRNSTFSKASGERSPFPVTVRFVVETPSAFEFYDIDGIGVEVAIDEAEAGGFSTRITVEDPPSGSLPASLRKSIADSLQKIADGRNAREMPGGQEGGGAPVGLALLAEHLKANFGRLVSSHPELLETYVVSDPVTGRSERRVAILDEDARVAIEVSVEASGRNQTAAGSAHVERLETDVALLRKVYGAGNVSCKATGAAFIRVGEEDKVIVEFLHKQGVGTSLKQLSSASHVLNVSAVPSSPDWMRVVPVDEHSAAPIPLRISVFVGNGYPNRSAILCRVQLDDREGLVSAEFNRMLVVFEKILLLKAIGTDTIGSKAGPEADVSVSLRDIVKDCLNHADEAMREAKCMYDEAMEAMASKRTASTRNDETSLASLSPRGSQEPEPMATKYVVMLHNLQMDGIDAMSLHAVAVEVLCSRCHKPAVVAHDSLDTRWTSIETSCGSCPNHLSISIQPRIIHASCNTIGIVATSGCKPLDFLPSCSFEVQCDCTATRVMRNQFHQGRWNEESCRTCHRKNSFMFERCVFQEMATKAAGKGGQARVGGVGGAHGSKSSVPAMYETNATLVAGHPLPQTGTCLHYRHSHRWLRFPCCGRRFPCDLCHEQHTDGHEMKWAKSMVCGFCSLEQRVDSKCAGCGKKLATSASNPNGRCTRFWEGGEGQRDKKRLSRRDVHKYRNSKAKTVSKKAFAAKKTSSKNAS